MKITRLVLAEVAVQSALVTAGIALISYGITLLDKGRNEGAALIMLGALLLVVDRVLDRYQ